MTEGVRKDIQEWIDKSDYDLITAEAMLRSGRYLYVFFCCQQAVEKRLKAKVLALGRMPPRIHDLIRLAELTGTRLSEGQARLCRDLNRLYVESRYPLGAAELEGGGARRIAQDSLRETKAMLKWLDQAKR